jgi:hypothetical protein
MRLSERAMLVNLSIAVWHAEREDTKRANEIATKYGSDPRMGKYRKYLVDPEPLKPILKKRGEMRNRHYELTLPWGDNSDRIITTAGFMRYRDEMTDFKNQLEPMFDQYAADYPDHVAYAATLLNGLYDPSEYPSPKQIRGYFRASFKVKPVPDAADFRANLGADEIEFIRKQIEADSQAAIQEAMRETVTRMKDQIKHLSEQLGAYNPSGTITRKCTHCGGTGRVEVDANGTLTPAARWEVRAGDKAMVDTCPDCNGQGIKQIQGIVSPFRDSIITNMRDLVDILPGMNIAGDARIDSLIQEMRQGLVKHDADTLRISDIQRENVVKRADDILKKMEDYNL